MANEKATPVELYKKFKHAPLECDCGNSKNHETREEVNGETVVECTKCKRFLKFPKELPKAEKPKHAAKKN